MSDDGGGGGDTGGDDTGGGDSNDYSSNNDYNNDTSDTHADNDYSGIGSTFSALSSAIDFTSAVESTTSAVDNNYCSNERSGNDYSGIGTTVSAFESATESYNNVESTRQEDNNHYSGVGSAFSEIESAATLMNNLESVRSTFEDDSSTRLQIDDVTSTDKCIPSGSNFITRNNYLCETSNRTTYIPSNNRRYLNNSSSRTGNSQNRDKSIGLEMIICAVVIVMLIFAMIIGANNYHSTPTYTPIKSEPLPQGVYNTLNMIAEEKNKKST